MGKLLRSDAKLLFEAHQRQLIRKGAYPGNLGWVVDYDAYLSKTDKGMLQTDRKLINGKQVYVHTWNARGKEGWVEVEPPPDSPWDYRKVYRGV